MYQSDPVARCALDRILEEAAIAAAGKVDKGLPSEHALVQQQELARKRGGWVCGDHVVERTHKLLFWALAILGVKTAVARAAGERRREDVSTCIESAV
jgi:hypothetical protein